MSSLFFRSEMCDYHNSPQSMLSSQGLENGMAYRKLTINGFLRVKMEDN